MKEVLRAEKEMTKMLRAEKEMCKMLRAEKEMLIAEYDRLQAKLEKLKRAACGGSPLEEETVTYALPWTRRMVLYVSRHPFSTSALRGNHLDDDTATTEILYD
ncbi:hypothetical protein SAY86_013074 [Trapa natans]|uniref:Uncharacterized protein n=1 Tax=Trapa natans TaxID=22666 RepID=A0AAN7RBB1_TRANT|nr:hypothetical protein SAY86_013074 [Trapa natans]